MLTKKAKKMDGMVEKDRLYTLKDAISLLHKYRDEYSSKFDESLEIVIKLGIDVKKSDQNVRGMVALPSGTGRKVKVAVFTSEPSNELKEAGADIIEDEAFIEAVKKGKLDFDVCITSPNMMQKLAPVAKILGPKGLMPNVKLGTVTKDLVSAVKAAKAGSVQYKNEKAGLVHAGIGKLSFSVNALTKNVIAFVKAVESAKPASSKGVYIRAASLGSTHGPAVRLDIKEIKS